MIGLLIALRVYAQHQTILGATSNQIKQDDRTTTTQITALPQPTPPQKINGVGSEIRVNGTPIRASKQISEEAIRGWLESQIWKGKVGSPLALFASQIAESPYSSTILAICYYEQNHCVLAPKNNYWGIGPGIVYDSPEAGISAIETFLAKHEPQHPTIESFRGWYCVDHSQPNKVCPNWEPAVLKIKLQLESLN